MFCLLSNATRIGPTLFSSLFNVLQLPIGTVNYRDKTDFVDRALCGKQMKHARMYPHDGAASRKTPTNTLDGHVTVANSHVKSPKLLKTPAI